MIGDNLSLESFKKILEEVNVGIALVDSGGKVVYANSESKELLGVTITEDGEYFNIISCHPYDLQENVKHQLNGKLPKRSWHRTLYHNGRWVENYLSVVLLPEFEGVIIISNDATEEVELRQAVEKANKKLKEKYKNARVQAQTDSLTGLYNRQYLNELLNNKREIEAEDLGVMMIDVNGFKEINDVLGHHEGDYFLKETARILVNSTLGKDMVIRYGGDEFLILLPDCKLSEVKRIKERIERNIENWNEKKNSCHYDLEIAAGYTSGKIHELQKLIQEADGLMYDDKRKKKR